MVVVGWLRPRLVARLPSSSLPCGACLSWSFLSAKLRLVVGLSPSLACLPILVAWLAAKPPLFFMLDSAISLCPLLLVVFGFESRAFFCVLFALATSGFPFSIFEVVEGSEWGFCPFPGLLLSWAVSGFLSASLATNQSMGAVKSKATGNHQKKGFRCLPLSRPASIPSQPLLGGVWLSSL